MANLAEILWKRREFARAESLYRFAVRRSPTSFNTTNLAEKLIEQGKLDEADSVLKLPLAPGPLLPFNYKATVLYLRGQFDAYERALDPNRDIGSRAKLALLQGRIRDWQRWQRLRETPRPGNPNFARPLQLWFLEESLVELFIRRDTARAVKVLQAVIAKWPADIARNDSLRVGLVYALAGRADSARALLERYESTADTAVRPGIRAIMHRIRGQIASIDGRVTEALDEIRKGDRLPDGPIDPCSVCLYAQLGDVFDRAHMSDSAVVMYEQYVNTVMTGHLVEDHWNLPRILNRLGELHEARGDREKAIDYYSRFVELWKRADTELQPRVTAVRQRLARLKNETN